MAAHVPTEGEYVPQVPPQLLGYTPPPASWPAADAALVAWFRSAVESGKLPAEPFSLWPHEQVEDPAKLYDALLADVERGPSGARARPGALHVRLRRLQEMV